MWDRPPHQALGVLIELKCLNCDKITGGKKFCSQSCSGKYNGPANLRALSKKYQEKYEAAPRKCKRCNKVIPYLLRNNKFCNQSCAAIFNNKERSKRSVKKYLICIFCKLKFYSKHKQAKYCNNKCQGLHRRSLRLKQIKESGVLCAHPATAKKYLIEIRGHKCEICHLLRWRNKPIPLVMDHINGNSGNNKLTNLRLVCGNCDMQLPTYKSKNEGNGRHWRKQRYKEGKSY